MPPRKKRKRKNVAATAALEAAPPILRTTITPHLAGTECIIPRTDPAAVDQATLPTRGLEGKLANRSRTVEELCRSLTYLAVRALEEVVRSPKTRDSTRVQAATALLDRGWGRPKERVEITRTKDLGSMSTEELEQIIAEAEAREATSEEKAPREIPPGVEALLPR